MATWAFSPFWIMLLYVNSVMSHKLPVLVLALNWEEVWGEKRNQPKSEITES